MHEFFQYEHIRNLPSNFPCAQAPLAAIKGRKWRTVFTHGDLGPHNSSGPGGYKKSGDWCNHRLGVFRMVSWVLGMYKTYHGPASAFKGFRWWEIFQDHVECSREELEADIILSAYLSINLWNLKIGRDDLRLPHPDRIVVWCYCRGGLPCAYLTSADIQYGVNYLGYGRFFYCADAYWKKFHPNSVSRVGSDVSKFQHSLKHISHERWSEKIIIRPLIFRRMVKRFIPASVGILYFWQRKPEMFLNP